MPQLPNVIFTLAMTLFMVAGPGVNPDSVGTDLAVYQALERSQSLKHTQTRTWSSCGTSAGASRMSLLLLRRIRGEADAR